MSKFYLKCINIAMTDENDALEISRCFKIDSYYNFIANGVNTLRRPGVYKYFSGLAAVPPGAIVNVENTYYEITSQIKNYKVDYSKSISELFQEIKIILGEFKNKTVFFKRHTTLGPNEIMGKKKI